MEDIADYDKVRCAIADGLVEILTFVKTVHIELSDERRDIGMLKV